MRAIAWLLAAGLVAVGVPANARTIIVGPHDSIQGAVDQAAPWDTVAVRPGTYHEAGRPCPTEPGTCAVVITQDNIALIALADNANPVILENAGGQEQGIAIAKSGAAGPGCLTDQSQRINGALVRGFTVNGFDSDGIFLFCVDNWRVAGNSVNDNAEYGIFPSHCGPGEVVNNVATGSNDTGIYVGQSHDVRVDQNLATGNVSGFELENSSNSRVDHNEATGNTGGILTFTNIFLDVKQNADNRVDHNLVHEKDRKSTRLNSSHLVISYAVFCLKKKNNQRHYPPCVTPLAVARS